MSRPLDRHTSRTQLVLPGFIGFLVASAVCGCGGLGTNLKPAYDRTALQLWALSARCSQIVSPGSVGPGGQPAPASFALAITADLHAKPADRPRLEKLAVTLVKRYCTRSHPGPFDTPFEGVEAEIKAHGISQQG